MTSEWRWPAGFRIRPSVHPESERVEVTDTVSGRRFNWSAEQLAALILRDEVHEADSPSWRSALRSAGDRSALADGWRHWTERRWYPSDQYYVASRRWDYADSADPDGAIRRAAVQKYLDEDGPPAELDSSGPRIALGDPSAPETASVAQLLVRRRSGRAYVPKPVPIVRLSGLLWYGLDEVRRLRQQTSPEDPLSYLMSYGSAWDFYVSVYDVNGLDPGVYRYHVIDHELSAVRPGDHREVMTEILQGMRSPATAAWTLGLVADFPRYQWRYRHEQGLRRLYLESGMLAQELLILGMSYGLSTIVTPAQKDRLYLELLELPSDRFAPVYTLTMGWSRGRAGEQFEEYYQTPTAERP